MITTRKTPSLLPACHDHHTHIQENQKETRPRRVLSLPVKHRWMAHCDILLRIPRRVPDLRPGYSPLSVMRIVPLGERVSE